MRVAIIGAGVAGLFSIKACLEENMDPVCYERHDFIGGMWQYRDDEGELGTARAYEELRLNSSRQAHIISDFPDQPGEREDPPTATQHLNYLRRYASTFKLDQYIRLNHEVLSVQPSKNHAQDKQWVLNVKHRDVISTEVFDAVIVCSGRYRKPIKPHVEGLDKFRGMVMNGNRYKHNRQAEIREKKILVIGNSYSACDIAVLASKTSDQIYLSIGRGCTIVGNWYNDPKPVGVETRLIRRSVMIGPNTAEKISEGVKQLSDQAFPDRELYGLTPGDLPPLSRPFMIQSRLPPLVREGRIVIKHTIKEVKEDKVVFDDGTEMEPDTIICCTGYEISFPFLSSDIVADTTAKLELYKLVFPVTTQHHNLAFVGCNINAFALFVMVYELQARWVAQVFKGNVKLSSRTAMQEDIMKRKQNVIKIFGEDRGQLDCTAMEYSDFLAEQIGCLPSFWKMALTDPMLAYVYWYGVAHTCHYRLVGPHKWPMARKMALKLHSDWQQQRGAHWDWKRIRKIGVLTGLAVVATGLAAAIWHAGPYPGQSA